MITWRLAMTLVTVASVAALFAALVVRLVESDSGTAFVSAIQAGDKPAAPQFDLAVMWPHSQTWPAPLQPKVSDPKIALHDLKGFPIVLNFWASWCTACGDEASLLARTAHKDREKVVFVGVNIHDLGSDAHRFLERHHENYASLRGSSLWEDYGLITLPETFYLDRRGRAVAHTIGGVTQRKLEAGITRALRD